MHRIPISIKYIISVLLCGLLFFTLFRCGLILANLKILNSTPHAQGIMWHSMFMGLRFDIVVSGYLLILPLAILIIAEMFRSLNRGLFRAVHVLIFILYSLAFLCCATDIPFFINFNSRLNVTVLNWTNSPLFMIRMVFQYHIFFAYFLLFLIISFAFVSMLRKVLRYYLQCLPSSTSRNTANIVFQSVISLLFIGLMLLGIRGRTDEKSPINVGTAYFCDFDFANQAGLNPVYTFMQSWLDGRKDENRQLHLMNDSTAISNVQNYLHVTPASGGPIGRTIIGDTPARKYNVVVVIMESMSWCYMHRYGNQQHLTPYLDSIAEQGYSFDNFFSAGIHTFNGIFSVLYSYPALMAHHTMLSIPIPSYTGLPRLLKQRGYETNYFTTHDDQFDNVGGFLTANSFNKIVSQRDYPSSQVISTLGVPDHYMFDYSLPILNSYSKQSKPFLAVYMTASNHPPYNVPSGIPFKPAHMDIHGGCVEYTDWAISNFMRQAVTQPWYNNTIFVFTGDHGVWEGVTYGDAAISYNHIPCIIYGKPLKDAPRKISDPGGQIDIFPTIAGILGGSYTNSTLGVDLLREKRQWMYFCMDDKIGVVDSADLYLWHNRGTENFYNMAHLDNIISNKRSKADNMKQYAFSMLQTAQWLLINKQTGDR